MVAFTICPAAKYNPADGSKSAKPKPKPESIISDRGACAYIFIVTASLMRLLPKAKSKALRCLTNSAENSRNNRRQVMRVLYNQGNVLMPLDCRISKEQANGIFQARFPAVYCKF